MCIQVQAHCHVTLHYFIGSVSGSNKRYNKIFLILSSHSFCHCYYSLFISLIHKYPQLCTHSHRGTEACTIKYIIAVLILNQLVSIKNKKNGKFLLFSRLSLVQGFLSWLYSNLFHFPFLKKFFSMILARPVCWQQNNRNFCFVWEKSLSFTLKGNFTEDIILSWWLFFSS